MKEFEGKPIKECPKFFIRECLLNQYTNEYCYAGYLLACYFNDFFFNDSVALEELDNWRDDEENVNNWVQHYFPFIAVMVPKYEHYESVCKGIEIAIKDGMVLE